MANAVDVDYSDYPTYELFKKVYLRRHQLSYPEFLEIIRKDSVLNNLSDHDKKLYFDLINEISNKSYYHRYIKYDINNKYTLLYKNNSLVFFFFYYL